MKKLILNTVKVLFISTFLLSCSGSSNDDLIEDVITVPEVQEPGLQGKYRGTWNSVTPTVTFTNFGISAELRFTSTSETSMNGEFYATTSFSSITSGETNDGKIRFTIEDNKITSFSLDDTIVGCTGNFNGTGVVSGAGEIIIDFTGTDCDGDHIGTLLFTKI